MKKLFKYDHFKNLLICIFLFSLALWIMSGTLNFFHNAEDIRDIKPGLVFCGGDYDVGDYIVFEKEYYDNVIVNYVDGVAQEPEYENYYVDQHIGKVTKIDESGAVQLETYSRDPATLELVFSGLYDVEKDKMCGKIYWNIDSVLFHIALFLVVCLIYHLLLKLTKR